MSNTDFNLAMSKKKKEKKFFFEDIEIEVPDQISRGDYHGWRQKAQVQLC